MSLWRYAPPVVFWTIGGALLVSYYGPISILNPFRHLLSMSEAMEYMVQLFIRSQSAHALFPITSEQSLNVVAGMFGLVGWLALMITIFVRYGAMEI